MKGFFQIRQASRRSGPARLWLAGLVALATVSVSAQTGRDPTVPPAALGLPADGGAPAAPAGLLLEPGSVSVLRRDGAYFLVLGTRVYAQGQRVGNSTIERITETEVWVNENGSLRKVPVFSGITRRIAPPGALTTPEAGWPPGTEFEL